MNKLYESYIRKEMLPTLFCPGCGNGIIQGAAIRAIEKLNVRERLACVSGIGCSAYIPCYMDIDVIHFLHGRALSAATGLKLAAPEKKVLVFSGDGDMLAIGGNHFLHACMRNIDLTVIMINNAIYGMTGGQKSPTTPKGAHTKTSPAGSWDTPIDCCALAEAAGATYIARWTTAHPFDLEKAICEGLLHTGFSFIEVLSQCPVQAGKGVFGGDHISILRYYRENTIRNTSDNLGETGKIQIGTFRNQKDIPDYETCVRDCIIREANES